MVRVYGWQVMHRITKALSQLSVVFISAARAPLAVTGAMASGQGGKHLDLSRLCNCGPNPANLAGSPFSVTIAPAGRDERFSAIGGNL
jgi:hypothetical protein